MGNGAGWRSWVNVTDPNALTIWREAMAQLRQLHEDSWNAVRFFLTVNVVVLAIAVAIVELGHKDKLAGFLVVFLALTGVIVTAIARKVLVVHRRNFLEMLLRKSLIERELCFYDQQLSGVDMSFPWRVDKRYLDYMSSIPTVWIQDEMRRPGTVGRLLFLAYEGIIALHILILAAAIVGLSVGYFS